MSVGSDCLNPEEYLLVKNTWDVVEKQLKEDGQLIFIRFFTDEELNNSKELRAHIVRVTTALHLLIWVTDEEGTLDYMTQSLVANHHCRGVRTIQFSHFNEVFNEYISNVLPTEADRKSWAKAMNLIAWGMSYDEDKKDLY